MSKGFKGIYYKHQAGDNTVNVIAGRADSGEFIQIMSGGKVYHFDSLDGCSFSGTGIKLDLPQIKGEIKYYDLTPLKSDIMGVFRFFPMQCRHSIVSMHHRLEGGLKIEDRYIDLSGGTGYIEGDSGRSFPKEYLWLHCNDFAEKCSITASVADIPFLGFRFRGCICAVIFRDREYRLATYKGVKIEELSNSKLILSQKSLRLEIELDGRQFLPLNMPVNGQMTATVFESNSTAARFKFFKKGELIFDFSSDKASFEYNF